MKQLPPSDYLFHPVTHADPEGDGCVGVGADLAPQTILAAYQAGIFPWFNEGDPICWWSPDPRCVIYPARFVPSKSLQRQLKKDQYTLTLNTCFERVMHACQQPRAYADSTWISSDIVTGYTGLHEAGLAYSVEVWEDDVLVGGLYGVQLGAAFFGESMFSLRTDVSKMAFLYLMRLCAASGFEWVDCQFENTHLLSLGAVTLPRQVFLVQLADKLKMPAPNWQSVAAQRIACAQLLDAQVFASLISG